jgi:hypothetical protein
MKKVYIILVLIILFTGSIATAQEHNLAKMSRERRNTYLMALAKEVVLKFGPDYYRDEQPPIIERKQIPFEGDLTERKKVGAAYGRWYYLVSYPSDTANETLEWDYAAKVEIWENSGQPFGVTFGNGIGYWIYKNWRTDDTIEPIQYEEAIDPRRTLIPYEEAEHVEKYGMPKTLDELVRRGMAPNNLDELLRKGRVYKDGKWIKTRPDVPPARRKKEK